MGFHRYLNCLRMVGWTCLLLSLDSWGMQDPNYALDWRRLLEAPDPVEITTLASRYENGQGFRHDYARARQLYCAAARLGHLPAQRRLAWLYAHGVGAPQDVELAAAWLEVAAAKGDVQARKFLAFLGHPGPGRQPRCTYLSRFDEHARAIIPASLGQSEIDWSRDTGLAEGVSRPTPSQIASWVTQLAPRYGLDPELILSVIEAESNFNSRAISHKNARGLMQLIPDTATRFGVKDIMHPIQNLHGGMAYMRWLLAYFQGDVELALAGYNAGEGAVEKFRGIPPYAETRDYVRKVIRSYGKSTHPPVEQVVKPSRILSASLAR
jgi:hypothetical protein